MTEIPTDAAFYEYRGQRYRFHSGGKGYARVEVEGVPTLERFPEALEFSADPTEPWVMLPESVFDVLYRQTVRGRWHGAPVTVVSVVKHGLRRGLVTVNYDGVFPDEAVAAGFSGNQYSGWTALVPPEEIEDISVETTRQDLRK
jgi:hypothetical protein